MAERRSETADDDRAHVRRLAARVAHGPLRTIVERLLAGAAPGPAAPAVVRAALADPSGCRWRERALAAWAAGSVAADAECRAAILSHLTGLVHNARPRERGGPTVRLLLRTLPLALLFVLLFAYGGLQIHADPEGGSAASLARSAARAAALLPLCTLFLSPFVAPASLWLDQARLDVARAYAAGSLGRIGTPESVGPLARAFTDGVRVVRSAAGAALPGMLSLLSDEHYGALPPGTVGNLCRLVDEPYAGLSEPPAGLVVAALGALGKVGGGEAVDTVRRLADTARDPSVRAAAAHVLPTLLARQRREQGARVLLRPADARADEPARLVRPAQGATGPRADVLVRPAGPGEPG